MKTIIRVVSLKHGGGSAFIIFTTHFKLLSITYIKLGQKAVDASYQICRAISTVAPTGIKITHIKNNKCRSENEQPKIECDLGWGDENAGRCVEPLITEYITVTLQYRLRNKVLILVFVLFILI